MLFRFLDKMRAKPAHVRARAAFIGAGTITAVIAISWMTTLPELFQNIDQEAAVGEAGKPSLEETRDQFSNFADRAAEEISDTNNRIKEAQSTSTIEVVQIATSTVSQ